ncbi:L-threonine ammonia-lyase-like isoform X2 [Montipora foliosa]|uniref:L-threonine ammonia-lyase-like isoform X2 n=1 Tax=Montipora foliosa TaxID=591990 RepID=UPI0035F1E452
MAGVISLEDVDKAIETIKQSPMVYRTPLLKNVGGMFGFADRFKLHLKLENMQNTGSFKVRGVVNQVAHLPVDVIKNGTSLVSMSAGNYGKALAFASKKLNLPTTLCMPETAPSNKAKLIESLGVKVERMPKSDIIVAVDQHVAQEGMQFLHPFDDLNLIAGMASVAVEILDEIPEPDVVIACCGGGGLLAGVAAGIKLKGHESTKIYGVEPEGAPTMYLSKQQGHAVSITSTKSIASGLAPPTAGLFCTASAVPGSLKGKEIIWPSNLLTKMLSICRAVETFFHTGLVVEASGAAAFAALQSNKIPDLSPESKVVVIVTGGNITPKELCDIIS